MRKGIAEFLCEKAWQDVSLVRINLEDIKQYCLIGEAIHVLYTICSLQNVKILHVDNLYTDKDPLLLDDLSPPLSRLILRYAPSLQILRLRQIDCGVNILAPLYQTVPFPEIYHVVYREIDWIPLWSQMPNLTSVSLKPAAGKEFVTSIGEVYHPGNSKDVKLIGGNCPKVLSISIDCSHLHDVMTQERFDVFDFLNYYSDLTFLEIKEYEVDDLDDFFDQMRDTCPKLQVLSLCGFSKLRDRHLESICRHYMGKLRHIYFDQASGITQRGMTALAKINCLYTDRWRLSRYFH